ncbi:hypothetical protein [Leucobacter sp. M11]|uniref:hypothetical protein n=1 Tax=Leucobacter sp. M11 TaxID=2993565 RepID=UPI002D807554|nr:hypothetical protein [Leucobacter sp. M11]MEB4613573.1 hypothetical protein [Leucobacter sp. M11]
MPENLSEYHADAADQIVTYDGLPASAGGAHGLRGRDPRAAAERVDAFLTACFRVDDPQDPVLRLRAGERDSAQDTAAIAAAVRGRFGEPRVSADAAAEWLIPDTPQGLGDALTLIAAAVRAEHSGLDLVRTWSGRLLDPQTRRPYAGISAADFGDYAVDGSGRLLGESGVRATIGSGRSSISLWLNLPGDERFRPGVKHLAEHLPITLSPHHWRRWQATRDGLDYRFFREPSPVRAER